MAIQIKQFQELSLNQLYDLVALRIEVFVVEQNCPYQELDGKDKEAFQLLVFNSENKIIGTLRILPPGVSYKEVSIGRVVSHSAHRNEKIGHLMMEAAMQFIKTKLGNDDVRISAQSHLCNFYSKYGFEKTGKDYLEDDIPHSEMLFQSNKS